MSFTIIDTGAEDMLHAFLLAEKQRADLQGMSRVWFLQCQFFHLAMRVTPSDMLKCLDGLSAVNDCCIYFCEDGDVIFKWSGEYEIVSDLIVHSVLAMYGDHIKHYMQTEAFFVDYNMLNDGDKLRYECSKKLKKQSKSAKELSQYFENETLISSLAKTMQLIKMQRSFRTSPHILIVEDQIFSQKMLVSILKDYTCHVAKNAGEALLLYMEKCPDVVLLDIELPDLSGHSFAKLIHRIDSDGFIVMVTGNQYAEDIKKSKENNVRGFIVKPYKKETILKIIDQFLKFRKRMTV